MSRRASWCAAALLLLHATGAGGSGSSERWTLDEQAENRRRYFDHIATMDVVFEGRVESCESTRWIPGGPCQGKSTPQDALDVRVDVGRVLVGTVRRTIVRFRTVWSEDRASQPRPGASILAWGSRDECDDWTTWGGCLAVGADGRFQPPFATDWNSIGDWSDARPPTLSEFEQILVAGRPESERSPLAGADSLLLVRVLDGRTWSAEEHRLQCRVERIGANGGTHGKRFWVSFFPRPETVWRGPVAGDSLLLPVRHGASGMPREFRGSPQPYRVRAGFVPGLDEPLADVPSIR